MTIKPRRIAPQTLALCGLLIAAGCLRSSHAPEPTPIDAAPQRIARAAVINYAQRLAICFDEKAAKLHAGEVQSASDANTRLQAANAAARQAAFAPVDELLNEELGGDRWDAAKASELFQQISQGLRSIP